MSQFRSGLDGFKTGVMVLQPVKNYIIADGVKAGPDRFATFCLLPTAVQCAACSVRCPLLYNSSSIYMYMYMYHAANMDRMGKAASTRLAI